MKIILRSPDGRFFEVEEDVVREFEIKPEDLPQGMLARQQPPQGGANGAPGGGPGQGGSPQIVIYTMAGGPGPQMQQGPPQGQPQDASQGQPAEGEKGDVEPRQYGWVS